MFSSYSGFVHTMYAFDKSVPIPVVFIRLSEAETNGMHAQQHGIQTSRNKQADKPTNGMQLQEHDLANTPRLICHIIGVLAVNFYS